MHQGRQPASQSVRPQVSNPVSHTQGCTDGKPSPARAGDRRHLPSILNEKGIKSKLSGNKVYYAACSLLVTLKSLCSKLHCQRVFIQDPVSHIKGCQCGQASPTRAGRQAAPPQLPKRDPVTRLKREDGRPYSSINPFPALRSTLWNVDVVPQIDCKVPIDWRCTHDIQSDTQACSVF